MRVSYNNRVWTEAEIKARIESSDESLRRALLIIYDRQTADEQVSENTKHNNGVGFSGVDGHFLTSVAKKVQKYGSFASAKQASAVRKLMVKYRHQVLDHIARKPGAKIIKGRAA